MIKLRVPLGHGVEFGPGKAALLDAVRETGSLTAAASALGMSYKRAWALARETNASFAAPLVTLERGGAGGGRAALTPEGEAALAHFRALEAAVEAHPALAALLGLRGDMSDRT